MVANDKGKYIQTIDIEHKNIQKSISNTKNANNQCQTGKHTNNQYQDRKSLIFSLASILLSGCKWSGCPTMQKRKEETNKQSINNVNNQHRARPSSVACLVSILLFGRVQRIWITMEPRKWDKQTNSQYQTKTDKHKEAINSMTGLDYILKIELSAFIEYRVTIE